jgi:hypothetical protein
VGAQGGGSHLEVFGFLGGAVGLAAGPVPGGQGLGGLLARSSASRPCTASSRNCSAAVPSPAGSAAVARS